MSLAEGCERSGRAQLLAERTTAILTVVEQEGEVRATDLTYPALP